MDFSLLETMRIDRGVIVRREPHLARAAAAAAHFGYRWDATAAERALDAAQASHGDGVWRTRLLVARSGEMTVECAPLVHDASRRWRVALATWPVASSDEALRYKTTRREIYERARSARPDVDEVLLWNERDEITESTIANVVAEFDAVRVTPPLTCGLLPGVFRAALLEAGEIEERAITKADLAIASRLWLINSLREWMKATLVP